MFFYASCGLEFKVVPDVKSISGIYDWELIRYGCSMTSLSKRAPPPPPNN